MQLHPPFQVNLLSKFISWCGDQEEDRLLWLGIALTVHGAALTPLTISLIMLTGFNFGLLMIALLAMAIPVVTNLAALPTKINIPVFALSILIDLGVAIACIIHYLSK